MEPHSTETDAESDARATAKAAWGIIREAGRALAMAHQDCWAPVLSPRWEAAT